MIGIKTVIQYTYINALQPSFFTVSHIPGFTALTL